MLEIKKREEKKQNGKKKKEVKGIEKIGGFFSILRRYVQLGVRHHFRSARKSSWHCARNSCDERKLKSLRCRDAVMRDVDQDNIKSHADWSPEKRKLAERTSFARIYLSCRDKLSYLYRTYVM